jgi:hypothetical protein
MAAASHALDHGDLRGSARHYARAAEWGLRGWSADIFYSRRLAAFASASTDFRTKVEAWRMAEQVAARATATSEEKQNAWFNLAAMLSPRNDPASVERCLRRSIAAAPNWYKPHWALAKVLLLENRPGESRSEADTAIACNGRRPELLRTLDVIRAAQVR